MTAREGRTRLWEILEVLLSDQRQAWQMNSDGVYVQLRPPIGAVAQSGNRGTHQTLIERTQSRLSREHADE